ncbi:MAG: hypothetical protein JO159_09065 [Acidobacteria bacterium]|nr:hypothetical protein [Acidobacteriota bacterium]
MKMHYLFPLILSTATWTQQIAIDPQVRTTTRVDPRFRTIDLTPHFVTTIRVSEPVNSVIVGDPALFQVEHSEREPELVFVKPLSEKSVQSNLLISTIKGRQISFLLVSHGTGTPSSKVDFLFHYQARNGFLIQPEALPVVLVSQTTALEKADAPAAAKPDRLDELLERQKRARLPELYGQRMEENEFKGDRLRAGISEVIDGGQLVVVLFSVIDTGKAPVLLMPPQVQLGGRVRRGKLIKHEQWSSAEQLSITDFRLSPRRIGPGDRADGVVEFERPPYKRSTETLFLQMAESGAVDKPALVPIGFGVSTAAEEPNHVQ